MATRVFAWGIGTSKVPAIRDAVATERLSARAAAVAFGTGFRPTGKPVASGKPMWSAEDWAIELDVDDLDDFEALTRRDGATYGWTTLEDAHSSFLLTEEEPS